MCSNSRTYINRRRRHNDIEEMYRLQQQAGFSFPRGLSIITNASLTYKYYVDL